MSSLPRVFVALDYAVVGDALALASRLDPRDCGLKVGNELFVTGGPAPVVQMVARGFAVFLDLKFHDIPNTVAKACAAATGLGAAMLNVHASGGSAMMLAARRTVNQAAADMQRPPPLLLAVTVLTSLDDEAVREIGGSAHTAASLALHLAKLAKSCGLDGVVCSAQEAPILRAELGPHFKLVTPGIRLMESARDDQARVVTPETAIRNGADYLVIGRPITESSDPVATLASINAKINAQAAG
jgi:orotidine-5'-phosphate decarboxylase